MQEYVEARVQGNDSALLLDKLNDLYKLADERQQRLNGYLEQMRRYVSADKLLEGYWVSDVRDVQKWLDVNYPIGIYSYQTKKDMTSYYACPECESEWKAEHGSFEPIYMGKHICSTDKECLRRYIIHKNTEDKSIVYSISRFCKTTSPLNVTVVIGDKK